MSTLSPPRPDRPTTPRAWSRLRVPGRPGRPGRPTWLREAAPETGEERATRLRLRRRLMAWSLPVVVLLLLVAVKLFATVVTGEDALRSYSQGNITGTEDAARRLLLLNVIEPHKAPFALGDARLLAGDLDGARASFEEALTLAPPDSEEACQVRVNLVLTLEKLATAATTAGRTTEAKAYSDHLDAVVSQAPSGCFQGDAANQEGQQLKDAQQRSQQQQQQDQQRQQDQQQAPGQPDQQAQPSPDKQQQLDGKTQDNLQQRQQGGPQTRSSGASPVDKPW